MGRKAGALAGYTTDECCLGGLANTSAYLPIGSTQVQVSINAVNLSLIFPLNSYVQIGGLEITKVVSVDTTTLTVSPPTLYSYAQNAEAQVMT